MDVVGKSIRRPDAAEKVTGQATYTGDLEVAGMAHAKVLPSPYPHARIVRIDASRARALSGVFGVVTRHELTDIEPYYGSDVKDRPIVAIDRARYEGEPVAAVAAVDLATAEAALELIDVDYDVLPIVAAIDDALNPMSISLHESNLCHEAHYEWGDAEQGFAEADHVFEDTFTFPMVYHYAMEPHTVIAHYDETGIRVWTAAQHPFLIRNELARLYGLPLSKVQVTIPYVGGGFGSKSYIQLEPLAVALSREARRPVRLAFSVEQSARTVRRHSARLTLKTGVRKDGSFVARDCKIYMDAGAYTDNSKRVTARCADRIPGPYKWPHITVTSQGLFTNTGPAGSFRALGGPQAAWASESQIDIIAAGLNMDPLELRLKNVAAPGEMIRHDKNPLDADVATGLQKAAEFVGWEWPRPKEQPTQDGKRRGVGLACSVLNSGASPTSTALVRLHADGSATAMVSTVEIGQGSRGVMAQIAAEELGIDLDKVAVVASDTSTVPYDRSTGSSRSTTLVGLAVQLGAKEVKQQLLDLAAKHFEAPVDKLSTKEGSVVFGEEGVTYAALIRQMFGGPAGELMGRGYVTPQAQGRLSGLPVFWEMSVFAAEVEVDERVGTIRVLRLVSVADVGKAINPKQVEGQDEGAAMQGIGHTLFEEQVYEDGRLLNPNLIDYRVPTFEELPEDFETILIENEDGPGPFGAKGAGEGGIVAVAAAIGNAVYQATGVRIKDLPLTPERVWRTLQRDGKG
ncbi:MAG: CO or xanthine dehydrogenase, Mo-binding subunit [Chloroflexi bacterium]|jgi:CO/xanthine dehydrogenase Mo-binding subunit|nr:MAG: CO or xanthine dehydrogenase, Mo-binding subunit [Chloroflexota bacterium]